MPSFNSSQYTQTPVHSSHPGEISTLPAHSGELYHTRVSYALAGTETAADTINLAVLPVGAQLVPQMCSVYCADPGTTLTLDVGYAANPDAYADGITLSADSANTLTGAVVLYFNLVWRLPKA